MIYLLDDKVLCDNYEFETSADDDTSSCNLSSLSKKRCLNKLPSDDESGDDSNHKRGISILSIPTITVCYKVNKNEQGSGYPKPMKIE